MDVHEDLPVWWSLYHSLQNSSPWWQQENVEKTCLQVVAMVGIFSVTWWWSFNWVSEWSLRWWGLVQGCLSHCWGCPFLVESPPYCNYSIGATLLCQGAGTTHLGLRRPDCKGSRDYWRAFWLPIWTLHGAQWGTSPLSISRAIAYVHTRHRLLTHCGTGPSNTGLRNFFLLTTKFCHFEPASLYMTSFLKTCNYQII